MAEALPCTRAKGLTGRWLALSVLLLIGLGHPTFFSGQAQKPKPLTPARQNNVIATAAPPATDATESSRKTVLLLSDASGRTASGLLAGVLAQFEVIGDGIEVQTATEVTTRERLQEVIEAIKGRGGSVLVLATLVDSTLSGWAKTFCADYNLQFVEVMGPLLDRMGGFLEQRSRGEPGASLSERAIKRILNKDFFGMVEAVKYSQRHIGGLNSQDWHEADIILVGPSRCGKGPVAHQLAMRGFKAAALNISPHDILPEELTTLQAYQVALITVEEERLVKLRQNRVADMKTRKMSMLVEDDYTEVARVRQDLQLTKELNQLNPHWPEAVDMTYLSPEECASLLIRQVKEGKKAAALRLPRTK